MSLSHDNVVKIFDFYVTKVHVYVIMELLGGRASRPVTAQHLLSLKLSPERFTPSPERFTPIPERLTRVELGDPPLCFRENPGLAPVVPFPADSRRPVSETTTRVIPR